jgi:FMN phosphatase YigB (HAD superfamily)
MVRTLLFDLDGTLLHVDMNFFLKNYFKALTAALAPYIPAQAFMARLWEATEAMIHDTNPDKTNREVFMENFFKDSGYQQEEILPVFEKFYREDYRHLQGCTVRKPEALPLLQAALDLGFELVIATNPLFPASAIQQRLGWAGIDALPYTLITSYEVMHFCKPKLQYYQEILDRIGRRPGECIMAGNDVGDDMVAGRLGIATYLVDDLLVNNQQSPIRVDWQGSLKDLGRELLNLREREAKT